MKPSLRILCALAALTAGAAGSASAQTAPAQSATVTFASGNATIVSAQGERRPATNGLALSSGDTVETGKGRVQLRMVDGALMSLQPETTLRLDEYHLATNGGTDEKGYMSLVKGGLRTVSGFIGKARPDNYRLQTPAGLIGIRGTEYTAVLREGLTVGVIGGRVAVCNDTGCQDVARGQSAFTAAMSARPVISKLVASVVPGGATVEAPAVAAAETASTAPTPAVRTSGEEVRGYLQTLLVPTAVDPEVPASEQGDAPAAHAPAPQKPPLGSFSPPPVVTAQAPSPSPAPAPGSAPGAPPPAPAPGAPAPAPAPGAPSPAPTPGAPAPAPTPGVPPPDAAPAPAPGAPAPLPPPPPAPIVERPLSPSQGTVVVVSTNDKGDTQGGAVLGYRQYAGSALVGLTEKADDKGKQFLEKPALAEAHSDGSIAWGRWTDGKGDSPGVAKGELTSVHYFTFAGTPTLPVLKSFSSFVSTATTVTAAKGQLVGIGGENAASGTLQVTFASVAGGFATYNLSVPVSGQTFSLAGTAQQTGTYGFAGPALITSTGSGCASLCAGALGGGNAVRGMVGGTGSSRAGLVYGFNSNLGTVSGAMVFKP